jgi:hypothetical protein
MRLILRVGIASSAVRQATSAHADVLENRERVAPIEVSVERKPELILMDLPMPSVNGLFGYRGPASYNRLRVCTNYLFSGGLHFKSEKRSYILVSSHQPFQSRC